MSVSASICSSNWKDKSSFMRRYKVRKEENEGEITQSVFGSHKKLYLFLGLYCAYTEVL